MYRALCVAIVERIINTVTHTNFLRLTSQLGSEAGRPAVEGWPHWECLVYRNVSYSYWSVVTVAIIDVFCSAAQTSRTWQEELCSTSSSATMFLSALVVTSSTPGTISCVSEGCSSVRLHVSFSKILDWLRWNLVRFAYSKNSLENIILVASFPVPNVKMLGAVPPFSHDNLIPLTFPVTGSAI